MVLRNTPVLTMRLVFAMLSAFASQLHAENGNAVLAGEATIYENQTSNNGGGDTEFCIGNLATTSTRRAFIRYTLPVIPEGATVTRVVWQLTQNRVRTVGAGPLAATLDVRRVTSGWSEGTGSGGGSGPCGGGANVAGVDWASQPTVGSIQSASAALSASNNVIVEMDTDVGPGNDALIDDVQAWVNDGATNFGWRLAVEEEGTADNARAMVGGALTIHWTVPPAETPIFADGFESQ